ncbi:MAG: hypothetical protein KF887_19395 [Paracoccaceae bacterium]|nr:MAG: hypothetical protein KF887_19395 [Paracoccaceae bacterium]
MAYMKFGVLSFSYASPDRPEHRTSDLRRDGINLGDYVQALAVRRLYAEFGIAVADVISVDRDTLPDYRGPSVILPMNACFTDRSFPLPPQIRPVFVGFQAAPPVVARQAAWLRQYQPIGCRDHATAAACRAAGIAANVTGCLSLTFPRRTSTPRQPCVMAIFGKGAGAFPAEVLQRMPERLQRSTVFVYQRLPVARLPLDAEACTVAELQSAAMLSDYRDRATLVVTPLHHAAAPCLAMGIPVVLARRTANDRFSVLARLLPLHLPPFEAPINWNPAPVDTGPLAERLIRRLRRGLAAANASV